jgi:tRNA(Arg) A34 adenosine deaminase TadA
VLTGGNYERTLRRAGARGVWRDTADLLAHLDGALQAASPGPAHVTWDVVHGLMREAQAAARDALAKGEAPSGCVLARGDGTVIARGLEAVERTHDPIAHAALAALNEGAGRVAPGTADLILACTLEPCAMCTGAAMEGNVETVVYALKAPVDSGTSRVTPPETAHLRMPRIVGYVLADEARALLQEYRRKGKDTPRSSRLRHFLEEGR